MQPPNVRQRVEQKQPKEQSCRGDSINNLKESLRQEAPQPLVPLVKGDSPVRGNVRNADKGGAVSGEDDVKRKRLTGGFRHVLRTAHAGRSLRRRRKIVRSGTGSPSHTDIVPTNVGAAICRPFAWISL